MCSTILKETKENFSPIVGYCLGPQKLNHVLLLLLKILFKTEHWISKNLNQSIEVSNYTILLPGPQSAPKKYDQRVQHALVRKYIYESLPFRIWQIDPPARTARPACGAAESPISHPLEVGDRPRPKRPPPLRYIHTFRQPQRTEEIRSPGGAKRNGCRNL